MSIWIHIQEGDLMALAVAAGIAVAYSILPFGRRRLSRLAVQPGTLSSRIAGVLLGVAALIVALSALIRWFVVSTTAQPAPFEYVWWRYAAELLLASGTLAVMIVVLALVRRKPEAPVPPTQPRTWRTYLTRRQLWLPAVALIALLMLVLFAGSVSSPDEQGVYRLLVVETGSDASGASEFFGWAYGVPVAVTALVLTTLTGFALRVNAVRPFRRPETVPAEEASRRALATRMLWFVSGVLLLTLSRALIHVAGSATLEVSGTEYVWGTSIATLSPWLSWTGMGIKLCAYILLLFVVGTTRFGAERSSTAERHAVADHERTGSASRG